MGFSFSAMWNNKCPRCRQGSIFKEPFQVGKPLEMPTHCSFCDQRTEPEPGFYFGAMFVSYTINTLLILPGTMLLVFYYKWSELAAISFMGFIMLISFFKILRGSRSLWLHLMVKHNPAIEAKVKTSAAHKK